MRNFLVDLILLALFVAELSFHHLPKVLHEILGVAMVALILFHVAINLRRVESLFKNFSPRKFFFVEVDVALLLAAGLIFVTGVCMSNHLFPDMVSAELRRNMTLHQLHVSAPYVMMILIGMHLGLHWREFWQRFLNLSGLTELYQRRKIFFKAAVLILSLIGVAGFFLNRLASRLAMKHIFSTPATDLPAAIFMLLIVGGVAFFTVATFFVDKKFFLKERD